MKKNQKHVIAMFTKPNLMVIIRSTNTHEQIFLSKEKSIFLHSSSYDNTIIIPLYYHNNTIILPLRMVF